MSLSNTLDRKTPPPIKDAVDLNLELKPYTKYILDNGVEVYAIDAGAEEVLQLEMVFFAGDWYEGQNGIAAATNFLLKNGSSKRTAYEINEHFDYYGSYLNRNCYNETSNIVLHCLTKHLHELLPVVRELITDSVFPQHELDIYKQNMKQRLEVNLKKCEVVANRQIDEYLYGHDHPYGKYSTLEMYDALDRDSIMSFYERFYGKGRCVIFVAGILPSDIQDQLNQHFGQLPFNRDALPEIEHPVIPSTQKKNRIINDPDGLQGAVRIARPFPNRHHPDYKQAMVLNTLLGGFFGSRLMDNIREDKGYTYGIYSYLQNHIGDSAWIISTEAGKDVCEDTIKEVYYEMKRLREEEIPEDELMMVKNYLMGTILGDLDGPFHVIGRWKNIILNGLDEQYFYETLTTIRDTNSEVLNALAKKYLREEDFYELVVV
jgi:predicted Zn-dependent peptidase